MATKRHQKKGQAIVEMAVALIAIMILVGGLVQFGLQGLDQTEAIMRANAEACEQAMSEELVTAGSGVDYIRDWNEGDDEARHSVDDRKERVSSANVSDAILAVTTPDQLGGYIGENSFTDAYDAGESMLAEFGLIRERNVRPSRDVLPVIRNTISGQDSVAMDAEAVMTWTKGLY